MPRVAGLRFADCPVLETREWRLKYPLDYSSRHSTKLRPRDRRRGRSARAVWPRCLLRAEPAPFPGERALQVSPWESVRAPVGGEAVQGDREHLADRGGHRA